MHASLFRYLPALCVLAVGTAWGFHLRRSLRSAERELERRQAMFHSKPAVAAIHPDAESGAVPPEELRRLRAAHLELLQLRGSIAELRAAAATTPDPEAELSALQARATALRAETDLRRRQREAVLEGRRMRDAATMAAVLVTLAEKSDSGRIPTGWDDVATLARRQAASAADNPPSASVAEVWDQARSESVPLERFEILAAGRRVDGKPKTRDARFVVRERVAREVPSPNGGWVRLYAFAGGDVTEATSPDGTFTAWEQEHIDFGPAATTPPRTP
ncbi:MAG: hypothetical protein JNL97_13350 [Verrucomicrobiales bacterium]|nr:hypothetical protein [Verrucomicrobiales bacterium]